MTQTEVIACQLGRQMVLSSLCLPLSFFCRLSICLASDVIRTQLTSQKSFNVYTKRNGMERRLACADAMRSLGAKLAFCFVCGPSSGLREHTNFDSLCQRFRLSLGLVCLLYNTWLGKVIEV